MPEMGCEIGEGILRTISETEFRRDTGAYFFVAIPDLALVAMPGMLSAIPDSEFAFDTGES